MEKYKLPEEHSRGFSWIIYHHADVPSGHFLCFTPIILNCSTNVVPLKKKFCQCISSTDMVSNDKHQEMLLTNAS